MEFIKNPMAPFHVLRHYLYRFSGSIISTMFKLQLSHNTVTQIFFTIVNSCTQYTVPRVSVDVGCSHRTYTHTRCSMGLLFITMATHIAAMLHTI